jgi:hypothetical protein
MAKTSKRTYLCPHCGEKLSFLEGTIIKLEGELQCETFSVRTQFFIPAELGRYGGIVGGEVKIQEGARVEFCCIHPACRASFTSAYNPELAEIRMVEEGREFVFVFNKVFGRRATFVVDIAESKLIDTFGEHADSYAATFERPLNFFGAV